MTSVPEHDSPTILPTGEGPDRNTPATDDPQHATLVEETTTVSHEPLSEAEADAVTMPATPGAGAMPVPHDEVVAEPAPTTTSAGTLSDGTSSAGTLLSGSGAHVADSDWLSLQGQFVDDPASAVREAGERVTREFEELRHRLEVGSTEDLRTAFQRYRSLHEALAKEAAPLTS